jgi:hypothetical protein
VLLGRVSGLLLGYRGAVFALALLIAIPTSTLLSRRLLVLMPIILGWIPLTYWRPGFNGGLGRVTIGLTICAAALALWAASGEDPLARLKRLVPRVRWVDLMLVAAGLAACVQSGPWWRARSGPQALSVLLPGGDNSSHYFMTEAARVTGGFADALGTDALGDPYQSVQYPSAFHTVVASVMELLAGPSVARPGIEVTHYVHALALVAALCVVGVTAAILSLPRLRQAPAVAVPLATLVIVSFTGGTGGLLLYEGFPNFFGAVAVLSILPVLVLLWSRVPAFVSVLAVSGAITAIANSWIFLLVVGGPAVLVGLVPFSRARWRAAPWEWVALAITITATLACVGRSGLVVARSSLSLTGMLNTRGGMILPSLPLLVVVAVAAVAVGLWPRAASTGEAAARTGGAVARAWRSPWTDGFNRRRGWAWLPVLCGIGVTAVVGKNQLSTGIPLTYYFWKIGIAVLLLSVTTIASGLALLTTPPGSLSRVTTARRLAGSVMATLAITQFYGISIPMPSGLVQPGAVAPGVAATNHSWSALRDRGRNATASRIIAAAESDPAPLTTRPLFMDGTTRPVNPLQQTQWFLALTLRWTQTINIAAGPLIQAKDPASAVHIARDIMNRDPRIVLLTPPASVRVVRAELNQPDLNPRVLAAPPLRPSGG